MMRWASPGSSTPFPSLYVQLAEPSLLLCHILLVFSVLSLFYLLFFPDMQGKLVVGHNMLLDVMHTIHQFYCPLPEVHV